MKFSNKDILITGFALLAMFFGAGNLIFPPMLGLQSGESLTWALLGFIVTGVGLPFLGVTAVAKAGGDLELIANRVHPAFSKVITTIAVLCIGPLLAIPRTAATTYEVGVLPLIQLSGLSGSMALLFTSAIFFMIVLFFVLKPTQLINNIGKILTPFMLIFLAIIIIKGVFDPIGNSGVSNYSNPFSSGFLEGYNTMDAIASVIFGMIIVKGIKEKGVTENSRIAKITMLSGVIAALGLAFIYIGLGYIGSTSASVFEGSNQGELLVFISNSLLGTPGQIVMGVVMALACLTTAIGLVASCGEYFSRLSNYRISYNTVVLITTLISFLLANMGLSKILSVSVPLLVFIYPIIIVLILLTLLHDFFGGQKAVYIYTVGITVLFVVLDTIRGLVANAGFIEGLLGYLPWYEQGLGWVIPALLTATVAYLLSSLRVKRA